MCPSAPPIVCFLCHNWSLLVSSHSPKQIVLYVIMYLGGRHNWVVSTNALDWGLGFNRFSFIHLFLHLLMHWRETDGIWIMWGLAARHCQYYSERLKDINVIEKCVRANCSATNSSRLKSVHCWCLYWINLIYSHLELQSFLILPTAGGATPV